LAASGILAHLRSVPKGGIVRPASTTPLHAARNAFVHIAEAPGIRRVSQTLLNLAPRPVQTWLRHARLNVKISEGFSLVYIDELTEGYRNAVKWLLAHEDAGAIGDYLEFGVFFGSSMMCMHRVLDEFGLRHTRLFGFDSWEGLPERARTDDHGLWQPGDFKMDYDCARSYMSEQGADWNRVHLVKGWFSETLTPECVSEHNIRRASLVMVDSDLYSSAKEALDFCAPLLAPHAVVFFDDWGAGDLAEKNLGEKRAFLEFLQAHPEIEAEETEPYVRTARVFRLRKLDTPRR
jgi:predicted O-methyltransferase YrrM